jgi:hypothetical protein
MYGTKSFLDKIKKRKTSILDCAWYPGKGLMLAITSQLFAIVLSFNFEVHF